MVSERSRATSSWVDCRYALASKWPLIVLTTSLALLVGFFLGSRRGPVYEAVAEVSLLEESEKEMHPSAATELRPSVLNTLRRREASLRSGVLLLHVIDAKGLAGRWKSADRVAALEVMRNMVKVRTGDEAGLCEVIARSRSSEESVELANAVALEFIAREQSRCRAEAESTVRSYAAEIVSRRGMVTEIETRLAELGGESEDSPSYLESEARDLRRRLVNVSNIIRSLEAKHQRAIVELQEVRSGVTLARKASVEDAREVRQKWQKAGIFSIFGFFVSSALVLLLSAGRSPFGVLAKISDSFQPGVAGMAPVPPLPLPRLSHPPDFIIEPYRDLRTGIHRLPASDCSVLSLVPEGNEPESADLAVNLASVLADGGHTVLLVDADFRNSRVHTLLDVARQPGLVDYLLGEMRLEESVIKSRIPNLWCMPSGPMVTDPCSLLGGKRMDDLFREMRSRFDYILLTSSSILTHSDAGVLSGHVDHAFVVSSYATHSLSRLRRVQYALESSGACVSGVFLAYRTGACDEGCRTQSQSHHAVGRGGSRHGYPARAYETVEKL